MPLAPEFDVPVVHGRQVAMHWLELQIVASCDCGTTQPLEVSLRVSETGPSGGLGECTACKQRYAVANVTLTNEAGEIACNYALAKVATIGHRAPRDFAVRRQH